MSLSHMSDYVFEQHNHEGQLCGVYIQSQYADDTVFSSHQQLHSFVAVTYIKSSAEKYYYSYTKYKAAQPRAPPYLS